MKSNGDGSATKISVKDGGKINFYSASMVDLTATIEGEGRIRKFETYMGSNDISTDTRWFDSFNSWESVNNLNIGSGGDKITVGSGSVGTVNGGGGNDSIKVSKIAGSSLFAKGGDGKDTLDFSKFDIKITFSLDKQGQYQNVGNPNDLEDNVAGYFGEISIENLIGGKKKDVLTGDDGANKLVGKNGNDVLRGGQGNDTLKGDKGNDVFVFEENGGKDTVIGYSTDDILRIEDHTGGFATLDISDKGGDLNIVHDGGMIFLEDRAGLELTDSNFDFV